MREGWREVQLRDVADTLLGKTLKRDGANGEGGLPYLRNVNVQWGRVVTDDLNRMTFTPAEQAAYALQSNDILVCEGGEVGRLALVVDDLRGVYFQNAIHRVRVHDGVNPRYVALALEHLVRSGGLEGLVRRVTIAHLNQTLLRQLRFLLPPFAEQRRIVDLIAAVDDAIEAADAEADRSEHAAEQLRMSLFKAFAQGPQARASDKFDMLLGRQKSARQSIGDHVIPYVRSGNLTTGAVSGELLTMNFDQAEQEKYGLLDGDVLMAEGGTPGISARWRQVDDQTVGFDKHVIRLRGKPGRSTTDFAHEWVRNAYADGTFARTATGITIKALGFGRASALLVPDVDLLAQVQVVSALQPFDDSAEAARATAEALRNLRSNLLTLLLSGEHEIPASYEALLDLEEEAA